MKRTLLRKIIMVVCLLVIVWAGMIGVDCWMTSPRKYYRLSPAGREIYRKLRAEWKAMTAGIASLIDEGGN